MGSNTKLYASERDADFDIQEEEALNFSKGYKHLAGYITFFMAECPQCGCTMPFELDEGVCMKCNCDPADGIVDDMSEAELESLLYNNRYHLKLPYVRRQPFETLPQMLARQIEYRYNEAIKKYNYETIHNTRADRQADRVGV